jgi:hypothetical protein
MTDLVELVEATWSDLSVILRTTEMAAIPWETLIRDGLDGVGVLVPPFAVVACGRYEDWPDYSPMDGGVYRVPTIIYLVQRKTALPKQEEAIESELSIMGQALIGNTYTGWCVPGQPAYDCSDTNPANATFAAMGNHPLLAGSVAADVLVSNVGSA